MYIAHFEWNKREPQKMYFSAPDRTIAKMEFSAQKKKSIRFLITKDKNLEVS